MEKQPMPNGGKDKVLIDWKILMGMVEETKKLGFQKGVTEDDMLEDVLAMIHTMSEHYDDLHYVVAKA